MRRNKLIRVGMSMLLCCLLQGTLSAQYTFGDQSPILRGVNNSVRYHNELSVKRKIPDAVVPLLAGVLITNNADPKSAKFQQAVDVWLERYAYLDQKIEGHPSPATKGKARKYLAEGNFPEVEKLLNEKHTGESLSAFFPATYQTSGNQSPILVGDNATVSYVVTKVIEYQLPESLTRNLLDRLYAQDQQINRMQSRIAERDEAIESWIARYRKLEIQLRDSPHEVNQTAWKYFRAGDLDAALREIEKGQASGQSLGQINYLKAQIQVLQFDYANYERAFEAINKSFMLAVLLDDSSPDINFQYARFLSEYGADNLKRLEILEGAYRQLPDDSVAMKSWVALQLAESNITQRRFLTAEEYLNASRRYILLEKQEAVRAEGLFLLQVSCSRFYGDAGQFARAAAHCDTALTLTREFPWLKAKYKRLWYASRLNQVLNTRIVSPQTFQSGLAEYEQLVEEMRGDLEENVSNDVFLVNRYQFLAGQYMSAGNLKQSRTLLEKSAVQLQPYINPKGQLYLQLYYNNWLLLLNILSQEGDYPAWRSELQQMDTLLIRLSSVDSVLFREHQSRLDFEYGNYFMAHNNPKAAVEKYKPTLGFMLKHLPSNPEGYATYTAKCIEQIGACYANLFKPQEGIGYLQSKVREIDRLQSLDDKNYAFAKVKIYRQIGGLYQLDGRLDSARIFLEKGMRDAESRLSAANDAFLYDYITLAYDYANSFVNHDNNKAIAIAENARKKIDSYTEINPYLRQRYIPDLAQITTLVAYIHAISRNFAAADKAYAETFRIYSEMQQPGVPARFMFANFMLVYCNFLENSTYQFPDLSKKERSDIASRKCQYVANGLEYWKTLPDHPTKTESVRRLQMLHQACK